MARHECLCTFKKDYDLTNLKIRDLLLRERQQTVKNYDSVMAKEFNIPPSLFHAKQKEFRKKHLTNKKADLMVMSDE